MLPHLRSYVVVFACETNQTKLPKRLRIRFGFFSRKPHGRRRPNNFCFCFHTISQTIAAERRVYSCRRYGMGRSELLRPARLSHS
jgi:hypothetical protein